MNTKEYFEATLLFEKDADPDEIISTLEWAQIDNQALFAIRLSDDLNSHLEKFCNKSN